MCTRMVDEVPDAVLGDHGAAALLIPQRHVVQVQVADRLPRRVPLRPPIRPVVGCALLALVGGERAEVGRRGGARGSEVGLEAAQAARGRHRAAERGYRS